MRKMSVKKLLNWFVLLFLAWSVGWFSHQQWNTKHDITTYTGLPLQQQPALLNETDSSGILDKEDLLQPDPQLAFGRWVEEIDPPGGVGTDDAVADR